MNWKKPVINFLYCLIKYINQLGETKPLEIKKDFAISYWISYILIYISILLTFFFKFRHNLISFIYINIITVIILNFSVYFLKKYNSKLLKHDGAMFLLFILISIFFSLIILFRKILNYNFLFIPFPVCIMTLNIFLGQLISVIILFIMSFIISIFYDYNFFIFILEFTLGIYLIFSTENVTNRKDITKVGLKIITFNILFIMIANYFSIINSNDIFHLLLAAILNGIISVIITLGILPYAENISKIPTNIKLLEITDFSQPILTKMLLEAPGTYNHSVVVANLAENAAREIGADTLIVKAGSYYHDIGKILKPIYFIENKPNFMLNKHDSLSPNMSALIIFSHVKDGIKIAKNIKLPKTIIDIIEEHHGNSMLMYFYNKAIEMYGKENIDEKIYRYPYRKPQSRESVIVMIADSVEAIMHSETIFSYINFKNIVNKVIKSKLEDGQFEESNITLQDLKKISENMIKTLSSIYHSRIKYPNVEKV